MLIKTEIPKLDELLNGGIEKGSKTLIFSTPGIKSLQFIQQIAYNIVKKNDKVTYITFDKKPAILKNIFKDYDWNISQYEKKKKFTIIDIYERIINKADLDEVNKIILDAIKNTNGFLIIDSISSFLDSYGANKETLENVSEWIKNSKDLTVISLLVGWPYQQDIIKKIKSKFDCVVDLRAIEKEIMLRNYFSVSKAKWIKNLKKQEVLFDIINPGGVREYIPKILVTGPYNSGKSTFTHAISTKSTSVDRLGTTVALDYGHINYKGYAADVFGTPGQTRFDPLLGMLGNKAVGLFLILDSTRPETFARAEEMISICRANALPYVIIANKQDLKKALSIAQIRKKLSLPSSAIIVPVVATKKKGIKKALDIFFTEVGD